MNCVPSKVTMPAASCPRCCRACSPRAVYAIDKAERMVERTDFRLFHDFREPVAQKRERDEHDQEGSGKYRDPLKPGRRDIALQQWLEQRREAQGDIGRGHPFEDCEGL